MRDCFPKTHKGLDDEQPPPSHNMKKLIITGAGASAEFGMPIGSGLVEAIRSRLYQEIGQAPTNDSLLGICMKSGIPGDYGRAAREIAGGLLASRSIDRFLQSRLDNDLIPTIGKIAIAYCLLDAEAKSHLSDKYQVNWHESHNAMVGVRNTWIGEMFSILQEGISPRNIEKIFEDFTFITFNYDRCIERSLHFLFRHIMGLDDDDAKSIARGIPIFHVYGHLGDIWDDASQIGFGSNPEQCLSSFKKIRTFTEGSEDGIISNLRRIVSSSDEIIITGFSFDQMNVDALFEHQLGPNVTILASHFGVDSDVLPAIQQRIGGQWITVNDKSLGLMQSAPVRLRLGLR